MSKQAKSAPFGRSGLEWSYGNLAEWRPELAEAFKR
jgi:hypothetical protein